ncbi:MAG TPA: thiamine-phosphate kinase [Terriglobales bacterium]|nr:thiamine-phosphate kinase [Terriglobales bacterium]
MPLPERELIARLRARARARRTVLGIGDDCAILKIPANEQALVTTDFSLEDVHFRRDWQSPECIGYRCLARGLSDIAAMGGIPVAAFLSLALPQDVSQKWVDRFFDGLLRLAKEHGVELAGGDIARSPAGVLADITVVGKIGKGRALVRSGARAGDQIYVTGELGESAAALQLLTTGKINKYDVFPRPEIAVGRWLVRQRAASACIDLSDGLSTDLSHICQESKVGAVIDADALPRHRSLRSLANPLDLVLHGGEDYELLFTAPKGKQVPARIEGVKIARIGEIVRGRSMILIRNGRREKLALRGWEHLARKDEELPQHLFVYGTLLGDRRSPELDRLLLGCKKIGTASINGTIFDHHGYPGAILDAASPPAIKGEVYKVLPGALSRLDAYEEYSAEDPGKSLYLRRAYPVRLEDGRTIRCWIYLANPQYRPGQERNASG